MKTQTENFADWAHEATAFRQQVRMAAVQVAGLRPDELAQALAYEVEPFSGIPATEAEVSFRSVTDADPTVCVYEVAVRRRGRRNGRPSGLDRWLKPAYAFAALVLALVAADGVWLAYRKSSLDRDVAERRPLQARLDRLRHETRDAHDRAAAARGRREAAARAQDEAAARRRAHADILEDLSAACVARAVVTSVLAGDGPGPLRVRAVAISAEAAAEVMQSLTVRVSEKGWRLTPGAIAVSGTGTTVGLDFELKREW